MSNSAKAVDMSFLAAASEGLMAMPDGEQVVTVSVTLGEAFDDWVEMFHTTATSMVAARGGTLSVSLEDFRKYVATLITSRIDYVNRRRPVIHPTQLVRVPTFVHVVLNGLGDVVTEEVGIHFVPEYTSRPEGLDADHMVFISNQLAALEFAGYVFALGYDRDRRGSQDLMMMQYISNEIKSGVYSSDRKAHIAMAPVAYFLELLQIQPLLGTRIRYAESSTLKTRLRSLARVETTKG